MKEIENKTYYHDIADDSYYELKHIPKLRIWVIGDKKGNVYNCISLHNLFNKEEINEY